MRLFLQHLILEENSRFNDIMSDTFCKFKFIIINTLAQKMHLRLRIEIVNLYSVILEFKIKNNTNVKI